MNREELDILFGNDTAAKDSLEKLSEQLAYDNLPEAQKGTLTDNQKDIEHITKSENLIKNEIEITNNTSTLDETEISSHNSSRILEEKEITKNTKELKEDPEGTISSHNFEGEFLN